MSIARCSLVQLSELFVLIPPSLEPLILVVEIVWSQDNLGFGKRSDFI